MTIQPARSYYSTERPTRREVGPPAPGQAYFGYPQPSPQPISSTGPAAFPVPQQARPNPLFAPPFSQAQDRPIRPTAPVAHLVTQPELWPMPARRATDRRPYRAHQSSRRSRRLHWLGYPLVLALGLALGAAVTFLH